MKDLELFNFFWHHVFVIDPIFVINLIVKIDLNFVNYYIFENLSHYLMTHFIVEKMINPFKGIY